MSACEPFFSLFQILQNTDAQTVVISDGTLSDVTGEYLIILNGPEYENLSPGKVTIVDENGNKYDAPVKLEEDHTLSPRFNKSEQLTAPTGSDTIVFKFDGTVEVVDGTAEVR